MEKRTTSDGTPPREERRRATPAARATGERRLLAIIERLADGIVILDRTGTIRFANPAAEALFGRSQQELVGAPFGFPVIAGDTTEIELLRRGGGVTAAELRVVEMDWEGEPAQLVSLRDVTDRRQADERARQLSREQAARAEAEAASQAKSEFVAMMSHELRTPLNAVLGYVELLELGLAGPLTEAQRSQLGRIRMSGRHLLGLVNEVLDLAKVEAGRLAVQCVPAPAADAIAAAVALSQPQAEERGLRLGAQQEGSEAPVYLGDEERVRQILLNLVSNAVKFTPSGGRISLATGVSPTPASGTRLRGQGPWVYFRVSDTGIGIAQDKLSEIFDPFVQVETGHTRSRDGSGLGLTISRRLARLMGGDLTAQSTVGHGSSFTLWVPRANEPRIVRLERELSDESADEIDVQGLADLGEALLREVEPMLDAIVSRIRGDPAIPGARGLRYSLVADHMGTMLADVAESLVAIEEASGRPSPLISDAAEIQRLIAERHGAQRARLGWTEAALRRENEIVMEEVERALRRNQRAGQGAAVEQAMALARRFLEQGELSATRALERTLAP